MSKHPIDAWLRDAQEGTAAMIARSPREPSFQDLLARARQLDPAAVPADSDAALGVVDIGRVRETSGAYRIAQDGLFAAFVEDARQGAQRTIARRQRAPIPALRTAPSTTRPRLFAAFVGAAAAVLVGAIAIGSVSLARQQHVASNADQASRALSTQGDTGSAGEAVEGRRAVPKAKPRRQPDVVPDLSADAEPMPQAPAAVDVRPVMTSAAKRTQRSDRLARLADEAQAMWRAGDVAGARGRFETIVAVGGRSRAAELAYADLFALTRQAGQTTARTKLWRNYLKRFPRGRFADDARAGLCRTAAGSEQPQCWQRYLDALPQGSYRSEAKQAIQPRPGPQ